MGEAELNLTLRELAADLARFELEYAILGDAALRARGVPREPKRIEVLLTQAGLTRFRFQFVGRGYVEAAPGAQTSFRNTGTDMQIDFVTPGSTIGSGATAFSLPEPSSIAEKIGNAMYADIPTLVATFLAAGSAGDRSVQDLIAKLELPDAFPEKLPANLRDAFRARIS